MKDALDFIYTSYHEESGVLVVPESLRIKKDILRHKLPNLKPIALKIEKKVENKERRKKKKLHVGVRQVKTKEKKKNCMGGRVEKKRKEKEKKRKKKKEGWG